jgi:hypothetical protein
MEQDSITLHTSMNTPMNTPNSMMESVGVHTDFMDCVELDSESVEEFSKTMDCFNQSLISTMKEHITMSVGPVQELFKKQASKIAMILKEKDGCESKLSKVSEERDSYKKSADEYYQKVKSLEDAAIEQANESRSHISALDDKLRFLNTVKVENIRLNNDVAEHRRINHADGREIERLTRLNRRNSDDRIALESHLSSKEKDLSSKEKEIHVMKSLLSEKDKHVEKLITETVSTSAELEKTKEELKKTVSTFAELEKTKEELKKKTLELNTMRRALNYEVKRCRCAGTTCGSHSGTACKNTATSGTRTCEKCKRKRTSRSGIEEKKTGGGGGEGFEKKRKASEELGNIGGSSKYMKTQK